MQDLHSLLVEPSRFAESWHFLQRTFTRFKASKPYARVSLHSTFSQISNTVLIIEY